MEIRRYNTLDHAAKYNHKGITLSYAATLLSGSIADKYHQVSTGFPMKLSPNKRNIHNGIEARQRLSNKMVRRRRWVSRRCVWRNLYRPNETPRISPVK